MGHDIKVDKPPFAHPDEQAHRETISRYTRDCLHKSGTTPFNILAGAGFTTVQLTGNQNDYDPGPYTILRCSSSTPISITGFAETVQWKLLIFINVGTNNITLPHENAGSEAHHRIHTQSHASGIIQADQVTVLWHDEELNRWRQLW